MRTVTVTTEIEVDPDDLYAAGWHPDDDCGEYDDEPDGYLHDAIEELHRQAHGDRADTLYARHCLRRPCRDLYAEPFA